MKKTRRKRREEREKQARICDAVCKKIGRLWAGHVKRARILQTDQQCSPQEGAEIINADVDHSQDSVPVKAD